MMLIVGFPKETAFRKKLHGLATEANLEYTADNKIGITDKFIINMLCFTSP